MSERTAASPPGSISLRRTNSRTSSSMIRSATADSSRSPGCAARSGRRRCASSSQRATELTMAPSPPQISRGHGRPAWTPVPDHAPAPAAATAESAALWNGLRRAHDRCGKCHDRLPHPCTRPDLTQRLSQHERRIDGRTVVGHEDGRLQAEIATERRLDLHGSVTAEQPSPDLVHHDPDAARLNAELTELLVAADEVVQANRIRPLQRQPGHRVSTEADVVVQQFLFLLEAEAYIDNGELEAQPEQIEQGLPGARSYFRPQVG